MVPFNCERVAISTRSEPGSGTGGSGVGAARVADQEAAAERAGAIKPGALLSAALMRGLQALQAELSEAQRLNQGLVMTLRETSQRRLR